LKNSTFLYVSPAEVHSYDDLIKDLNLLESVDCVIQESCIYQYFVKLIGNILAQTNCHLVDSDFSSYELDSIIEPQDKTEVSVGFNLHDVQSLIELIRTSAAKITIYTSGTTGRPKAVNHTLQSISRGVKIDEKYKNNRWLFAFNPSHMAGLQVFLQALMNQNSLSYAFGKSKNEVIDMIQLNSVSHISATPTFYRMLLPTNIELRNVESIALGGEKSSKELYQQIEVAFPNAKVINIYASTEAGSLLTSVGDNIFSIKEKLSSSMKIEDDTLFIHRSLLGEFDNGKILQGEWYNTGDLVELIGENPITFRFVSRKSELINVGGYKVNPNEIDEVLLHSGIVKMCSTFAMNNSVLGSILCVDVVLNDSQIESKEARILLKQYLKKKLQDFKIPRKFNFVEELEITRTGKVKRKI
jgi:acyl-coenzyme A synthetase/AMP-(fatty) acid ligase